MNLTIQVDETKFKEVLEKELNAFTNEELHAILVEALKKFITESDVIRNLFVTKETRYPSRSYGEDVPTELLINLCKGIDINEECKEIVAKIKDEIKTNSSTIVTNVLIKCISRQLFDEWRNDELIQHEIFDIMRQ